MVLKLTRYKKYHRKRLLQRHTNNVRKDFPCPINLSIQIQFVSAFKFLMGLTNQTSDKLSTSWASHGKQFAPDDDIASPNVVWGTSLLVTFLRIMFIRIDNLFQIIILILTFTEAPFPSFFSILEPSVLTVSTFFFFPFLFDILYNTKHRSYLDEHFQTIYNLKLIYGLSSVTGIIIMRWNKIILYLISLEIRLKLDVLKMDWIAWYLILFYND